MLTSTRLKVENSLAKVFAQQIDLGEETGPRTIISGLVKYVPIEQMQDKWLIVVVSSFVATQCNVSRSLYIDRQI